MIKKMLLVSVVLLSFCSIMFAQGYGRERYQSRGYGRGGCGGGNGYCSGSSYYYNY